MVTLERKISALISLETNKNICSGSIAMFPYGTWKRDLDKVLAEMQSIDELSNCLPAIPAISNTQNRHQINVLLSPNPDATLTFSQIVFRHRNCHICCGPCVLPALGPNCSLALTERGNARPRVFVISEVCGATLQADVGAPGRDRCLHICCQTKSDGTANRTWTRTWTRGGNKNPKL